MTSEKQLATEIKLLEKLRDKTLKNSEELPYLFARNLAKKAYYLFVEELREKKQTLRSL